MHHYDNPTTIRGIAALVRRHLGKAAAVFVLVVLAGCLFTAFSPRKYESTAKLYVRLGRENVSLDPTAAMGQVVNVHDSREHQINAVYELLTSRGLQQRIVDRIGEGRLRGEDESESKNGLQLSQRLSFLDGWNLNPLRSYSEHDDAIEHLSEHLGVRSTKSSSVVTLSYEDEDGRLAHEVLTTLIEEARDIHLLINRTQGSQTFFSQQAAVQQGELTAAETELRDYKNEHAVGELVKQRELLMQRMTSLESELSDAQAAYAAAEQEIVSRAKLLAGLPKMVIAEEVIGQPNHPEDGMREQLFALQLEEKRLSAKHQDTSPELIQVRDQIALAQLVLNEEPRKQQVTNQLSSTHQALTLAQMQTQSTLAGLSAKREKIQQQLAGCELELKTLNQHEIRIAQMQRKIELSAESYQKYAQNLEQTRIDEALLQEKISSLNLMQHPTISDTPSSPNTMLNLAGTLAAALVVSVGAVVYGEHARRSQAEPPSQQISPRETSQRERTEQSSNGESVPIEEDGWQPEGDVPEIPLGDRGVVSVNVDNHSHAESRHPRPR